MFMWRQIFTLMKREAWEYRDWWTWIMAMVVVMAAGGLIGLSWQLGGLEPDARAFRDAFFLRLTHGLLLVGGSVMALSHAAHGVFDERQDRSIGFWQSWPVPEKVRLFAKSSAIAIGWPLLAAIATSLLLVFCLVRGVLGNESAAYFHTLGLAWIEMMRACVFTCLWSWPFICGWLWCSAKSMKSPWMVGLLMGGALYAAGEALKIDGAPLALAIALGPVLPAVAETLGKTALLPWELGGVAWFLSCIGGWVALLHAGRSVGDVAQI